MHEGNAVQEALSYIILAPLYFKHWLHSSFLPLPSFSMPAP